MATVKKLRPIQIKVVTEAEALDALTIFSMTKGGIQSSDLPLRIREFQIEYGHRYDNTMFEIWRWYDLIAPDKDKLYDIYQIYKDYTHCILRLNKEPMKIAIFSGSSFAEGKHTGYVWVFKGYVYEVKGFYSDDEIKLLILEDFDKERRYFEKLKVKFGEPQESESVYERPRIPESVRIEVWRRDGGKCARCGSREKLEYDHIVPISKGGSNTARNIELLCEKHNRSKSNNIV